jgi:hypothetical protein
METVVIYTTYNDLEAEMIRNLLLDNDIQCQVVSNIAHSVFPFTHDHNLSEVRIAVNEQEAHRAEELIHDFLNASESEFSEQESTADESNQGDCSEINTSDPIV